MKDETSLVTPPESQKLPRHVKQVGTVGEDDCRIYIEDYVYTYLNHLCKVDLSQSPIAVLIGEQLSIEGQEAYLISGAIKAEDLEQDEDKNYFTDEAMEDILRKQKAYFQDKECLGWMNSQPGYGVNKNSYHMRIQESNFSREDHLLLIMDPTDKSDAIYRWDGQGYKRIDGYFIYYDRNVDMHNYMLDYKVQKPDKVNEDTKIHKEEEDAPKEYRRIVPLMEQEHIKKVMSLLTSLTAVLVVLCVVMGLALIRTDQQLELVQGELTILKSTMASQNTLSIRRNTEATDVEHPASNINEGIDMQETDNINQEEVTDIAPQVSEVAEVIENNVVYDVPDYYVIQLGDNLNAIAETYYGTTDMVERIVEVNGLKNKHQIYAGKKLKLPKN